jgi:hypothetical protein
MNRDSSQKKGYYNGNILLFFQNKINIWYKKEILWRNDEHLLLIKGIRTIFFFFFLFFLFFSSFFFFFFFSSSFFLLLLLKHYILYKVLARCTTFFQLSLFCATFFQLRIYMLLASSKTSYSQRILGVPTGRLDMGFHLLIFCTELSSVICSTCRSQLNLCF